MQLIGTLKNRIMRTSRHEKLAAFYANCSDKMTVLDAGVSAERDPTDHLENYFLKQFKYAPENYTGLGVQDLSGMEARYPGKTFVRYAGGRFPFKDLQFDWVFSNAVIEHVGDDTAQLLFLNEMLRVGRRVFFTTPNKFFPVEAHTNALFLHWHNGLFYWWCRKTGKYVRRDNLYLLSARRLRSLLNSSSARTYELRKNRVLGLPMTFTVLCESGR